MTTRIPTKILEECPLPDGWEWSADDESDDFYPGLARANNERRAFGWLRFDPLRAILGNGEGAIEFDTLEDACMYIWLQFIHGDRS